MKRTLQQEDLLRRLMSDGNSPVPGQACVRKIALAMYASVRLGVNRCSDSRLFLLRQRASWANGAGKSELTVLSAGGGAVWVVPLEDIIYLIWSKNRSVKTQLEEIEG